MEEIEYKLDSRNPILISHAISKLLDSVANKIQDSSVSQQDLLKTTGVQLLLSKCQSADTLVSTTACSGFVTLVETGVLSVSSALSSLISSLVVTKNHRAFITAINSLLIFDLKIRVIQGPYVCPLKINSPQHPFITILNQEKQVWREVLSQMRFDINHHQPEISSHSEQLLRPVFLHILLNSNANLPEMCRQQTWNLLIKSDLKSLKLEVLQWFSNRDFSSLIDTNHRLLELAEVMLSKDGHFSSALMPIIASYGIQVLKQGRDPRLNLDIIREIGKNSNSGCCLTIAILSSGIAECPVIYLLSLVETCKYLLEKGSCSSLVANGLLSSLLQWQAYPAFLSLEALRIAQTLIDKILSKKKWNCDTTILLNNEIFVTIINSFPDVQFYIQLCNLDFLSQEEIISWLKTISQSPKRLKLDLKHFLYSLFLETQDSKITTTLCDILLEISDSDLVASQLLPLILYKLTNSHSYEQATKLLFTVPHLAITKENVPIIINTFETLLNSGKPPLKHLAIDLYYRAWKKEARLHSCLMKVLINARKKNSDQAEHCEEFNSVIIQAKIMKEMCEIRPENAAELVPLLSEILNRKTNKQCTPANALALKGISALCKSGIIDVSSTWKALAPRFERENHPVVLKALCEFISEIPTFISLEEEHFIDLREKLLSKLWNLVLHYEDIRVPKSALNALKAYKFELLSKKVLPPNFGSIDLNLIEDLETNLNQDEISGRYWIHMLENLNPKLLSAAGDLLMTYVEEETKFLPQIRGEAVNYKKLSTKSIIKVIGQALMEFQPIYNNHQRLIITELLRIFGNKYSRPLPTVKYGFLEKCTFSKEAKNHCFSIICNQAEVSPSARKILEKHLTNAGNEEIDLLELLRFYKNLESICRGASPYILQHFLQVSLNLMIEKSLLGNKNYSRGFQEAMGSVESTLKNENLPEISRGVIVSVLENLFETVNEDSIFSSYLMTILEIPREDLLRITSGDWEKIDDSRLKKAMLIRTEWALKQNRDDCWDLIEEIFQECISRSETYECVLKTIQRIQIEKRLTKLNFNGILSTMEKIQSIVSSSKSGKNSESEVDFLCDVLLTSICFLSGMDSLEKDKESLIKLKHIRIRLFPLGLLNLVKNSDSRETVPKIMMWLHCLRTNNAVSLSYRRAFHNALISLRNETHFESAWMTFVDTNPNFESTY